jgi:Predicted membrane protein (DUF2142)
MIDLAKQKLRWSVALLCLLAAIRVFIFAATFPFFNNVDEQAHVDLVVKYAHADWPRGIESYSNESARYFTFYSSPEYFLNPDQFGGQFPSPNWTLPSEKRQQALDTEVPIWESRPNHESGEPPLYYTIAGAWMNLGRAFGFRELSLLYWTRFLNIIFAAALVWIGFSTARSTFPDNQFLPISIAVLLTVWPQSAFYSIQADALSPICFGITFLGLARFLQNDRPNVLIALWIGLAAAATCLVKTANLPLLIVVTIAVIAKTLRSRKEIGRALLALSAFVLSAAIPIGIWFAHNLRHFGDLTATKSKVEMLQWTQKPFFDWWSHPIFSLGGFAEFWSGLIASFWRGEFVWRLQRMASPLADTFYAISSAIAIVAAIILLFRRAAVTKDRQFILWIAVLSFLSIVAFLILLSIEFDFGNSPYPSREHPYFTSGRLLDAAAVPFFLIFVFVIDRFSNWMKREWLGWVLVGAAALFLAVSQIQVNLPAFASRYNFFHRP